MMKPFTAQTYLQHLYDNGGIVNDFHTIKRTDSVLSELLRTKTAINTYVRHMNDGLSIISCITRNGMAISVVSSPVFTHTFKHEPNI